MKKESTLQDPTLTRGKGRVSRIAMVVAPILLTAACASPSNSNSANTVPNDPVITKEAERISTDLYDRHNFPKGVRVPGVLNGLVKVTIKTPNGNRTGSYSHPVILEHEWSPRNMSGIWIGVPGNDAQGHAEITPLQLELGTHGDTTETLVLDSKLHTVLNGAGIYPTAVKGAPDTIIAFDITGNGNFPSVPVQTHGMK